MRCGGKRGPWTFREAKIKPVDTGALRCKGRLLFSLSLPLFLCLRPCLRALSLQPRFNSRPRSTIRVINEQLIATFVREKTRAYETRSSLNLSFLSLFLTQISNQFPKNPFPFFILSNFYVLFSNSFFYKKNSFLQTKLRMLI